MSVLNGHMKVRKSTVVVELCWTRLGSRCCNNSFGFRKWFFSLIFSCSRRIGLLEWFYNSSDSDVDFKNFQYPKITSCSLGMPVLLKMSSLDAINSKYWQRDQSRCCEIKFVIHEGVDCNRLKSIAKSETVKGKFQSLGIDLPEGAEVLTYVSRCLRNIEVSSSYKHHRQASIAVLICIFACWH